MMTKEDVAESLHTSDIVFEGFFFFFFWGGGFVSKVALTETPKLAPKTCMHKSFTAKLGSSITLHARSLPSPYLNS